MTEARRASIARWIPPLLLVVLCSIIPPSGWAAVLAATVAAAALSALAWRRRAELASTPHQGALAAFALASLALAVLPTLLSPPAADANGRLVGRLLAAAFGWSVVFAAAPLAPAPFDDAGAPAPPRVARRSPLVLVAGSLLLAMAAHAIFVWRYAGAGDEVLYLLQGRLMGEPGFVRRLDPALARFFVVRQMGVFDGRLYTQYPPGWPALLWAFDAVGLRWLSPCLLTATAVALTYELGRRLQSEFVGLLAAALLATNYWFVQAGATYGAHGATTCLILGGALLALAGERNAGRRRTAAWIGSGFLLGCAVAVRPLTGVGVGLSVLLWVAARGGLRGREVAAMTALMAVGAVLPALGVSYYNLVTNGAVLRFGYHALNGRLNDLGFGTRGYTGYDPSGRPVSVVENFTVGVALRQLAARAWDVASNTLTPFLLLPLFFVARLTGRRHDGRLVAAFAVLPALHAFYFFSETRFYLELFPFLCLGVAVLVADIRERREALARWLLTVGLVGNLALVTFWLAIGVATFPARMSAFHAVERAAAANGRVLVFVADSTTESRGAFYSLYWYNVDRPVGRVVVARDLGLENARLTARLPDHAPFRLTRSSDGEYRLAPLR